MKLTAIYDVTDYQNDPQKLIEFLRMTQKAAADHGSTINQEKIRFSLVQNGMPPDDIKTIMHAVFGAPQTGKN